MWLISANRRVGGVTHCATIISATQHIGDGHYAIVEVNSARITGPADRSKQIAQTVSITLLVASGKWQVAGGKWQVASSKWPVAGGKWQVVSSK